jgi:hypothetical protein
MKFKQCCKAGAARSRFSMVPIAEASRSHFQLFESYGIPLKRKSCLNTDCICFFFKVAIAWEQELSRIKQKYSEPEPEPLNNYAAPA